MKLKEGFIIRELAGRHTVVPMTGESKEFHGMIQLNDTGAFLWKQLERGCTKEELLQRVLETYEIAEEQAGADIDAFLQTVEKAGLLCE